MRLLLTGLAFIVISSAFCAEPDNERIHKLLTSDDYTVRWGTPVAYSPGAELVIGDGNGHGGTFGWIRFKPNKDGIDVLSIQFDQGWHPYDTKWPPDRAPVKVKTVRLSLEDYAVLLHDIAIIDAATLKFVPRNGFSTSSNDFWVSVQLSTDKESFIDLDWAGYQGSLEAPTFAKPRAIIKLARAVVEKQKLKKHTLIDAERVWASKKFIHDWEQYKNDTSYWWVREHMIETIGVVGDKSVIPVLRKIIVAISRAKEGEDRFAEMGRDAKNRSVYYAINAVTRLVGKDVCPKPVEEMDLESTQENVLERIKDEK